MTSGTRGVDDIVRELVATVTAPSSARRVQHELVAACTESGHLGLGAAADVHLATVRAAALDFDGALTLCERALESLDSLGGASSALPELAWWFEFVYGDVLDELGHEQEAAHHLRRAVGFTVARGQTAEWSRVTTRLMWVRRRQGDARETVALLRELVERIGGAPLVVDAAVGEVLRWLGRADSAVAYHRRCLDSPVEPVVEVRNLRELARSLVAAGHLDDAERYYDLASAKHVEIEPTAHEEFLMAQVAFELAIGQQDYVAAESAIERASAAIPTGPNPYHNRCDMARAITCVHSGRPELARPVLDAMSEQGLGRDNVAIVHRLRSVVAEHHGEFRQAVAELRAAEKILIDRYLATPALLQIEGELAEARSPRQEAFIMPSRRSDFSREEASREQLLLAAAKDLRGPISVFEIGTELLESASIPDDRVTALFGRGLAEMELVVAEMHDIDRRQTSSSTVAFHEGVLAAVDTIRPILDARHITIEVPAAGASAGRLPGTCRRGLTSLLAIVARAADASTHIGMSVRDDPDTGPGGVTLEITAAVARSAQADATTDEDDEPTRSLLSATAGAPSSWALANELLGTVATTRVSRDSDTVVRVGVLFAPPAVSECT